MQRRVKQGADSKANINVLVAEDDAFQRIAIFDLLQLCGFTVVACENGLSARDELLRSENDFDLILLDLLMPEMTGLELLQIIKSIEKMKDIPVIMMSSDGENQVVGACLSAGAQDYLVKPVNFKKLQSLEEFARKKPKPINDNEKAYYSIIRNLGKGASGSVELVLRSTDQEYFAMKVIPMFYMNEQEKKNAENEISLLKVLVAPTIIRYLEHFIETDSINIIMEYAEGGSLFDKIQEHSRNGTEIDKDQILYWMAQLVIAVQFMHNKNILHRDIKTQNMFLKKNIVKLGDFGISKALGTHNEYAKTFLGTPYFMPPEVLKGQLYGVKADVWALGCALYELVVFKRPFQHDSLQIVFDIIMNKPHEIPANVDKDLVMLIDKMLNKDPNKRPNIWDIAKMPMIEEKINQFYAEHPGEKTNFARVLQIYEQAPEESQNTSQEEDTPEKLVAEMIQSIQLRKLTQGLLNQVQYVVVNGYDIHQWMTQQCEKKNQLQIQDILKNLFEQKLIYNLNNATSITNSSQDYYTFAIFLPTISANQYQLYQGASCDIMEILEKIIKRMKQFQKKIVIKQQVSEEIIGKSFKEYFEMILSLQELQKATMIDYSNTLKSAVFINLYQIMRFHQSLQTYYVQYLKNRAKLIQEPTSITAKILSYIAQIHDIEADFSYLVGGTKYSLMDIKHGILRNNQPAHQFTKLPANDPRLFKVDLSPIVTIFKEEFIDSSPYAATKWELVFLEENTVVEYLQKSTKYFIQHYVCLDIIENEIIVHPLVQNYINDFGKTQRDTLEWLLNNIQKQYNKHQILQQYDQQDFYFRFKNPNE